jgi:hypothetical protein
MFIRFYACLFPKLKIGPPGEGLTGCRPLSYSDSAWVGEGRQENGEEEKGNNKEKETKISRPTVGRVRA